MAGLKRKVAPSINGRDGITPKKVKKAGEQVIRPESYSPPSSPKSSSESDSGSSIDLSDENGVIIPSNPDNPNFGPTAQERGEAESDSDPIVESDTTEHSGEDDGVSWPADDEPSVKVDLPRIDPRPDLSTTALPIRNTSKADRPSRGARDPASGTSSREVHAKQKILASERKASKPNAVSIARTKKLWERLRRKSHVPLEERKKLVAELFDIISGNIQDFVFKHDSVRVVQTALKYANIDQRKMIAQELKGTYRTLSESKYAKFLVGKLLVHGDAEVRDLIVPELYGHVRRLIKHPEASWILDDIYRGAATPNQRAILLREWYGAEFAIFKSKSESEPTSELRDILNNQPEKRKPVMHALHALINQCIQKKTTGFTMLHDAMLQYYLNLQTGGSEATEFLELLKGDEEGDLLKNLAFTKSGAQVVCLALARGNAKDRKNILRTYKDIVQMLAFDTNGHHVILTAFDVVDDTVLLSKSVISELLGKDASPETFQENLLAMVTHLTSRIPVLYPFSGKVKRLVSEGARELLNDIDTIRTTTSKKDPEVRRKELIASLSPPLLSLIQSRAEALVASIFGCQFISEVIVSAIGDRRPAMNKIGDLMNGSQEIKEALSKPAAGRMLKTLVQGGHFNPITKSVELAEPPLGFHDIFYDRIKNDIVDWATSGNSFVVVAMLETEGFSHHAELRKRLKSCKAKLAEAGEKGNKGSQLLIRKLES